MLAEPRPELEMDDQIVLRVEQPPNRFHKLRHQNVDCWLDACMSIPFPAGYHAPSLLC
jgi:hypothetical protein